MQTGKGISIPSILKVGKGALTKIGSYLKNEGIEQAVIFFGNGLIDMFGTDVMNSLKQDRLIDFFALQDILLLSFVVFIDQLMLVLYNSCCKICVKKRVNEF